MPEKWIMYKSPESLKIWQDTVNKMFTDPELTSAIDALADVMDWISSKVSQIDISSIDETRSDQWLIKIKKD